MVFRATAGGGETLHSIFSSSSGYNENDLSLRSFYSSPNGVYKVDGIETLWEDVTMVTHWYMRLILKQKCRHFDTICVIGCTDIFVMWNLLMQPVHDKKSSKWHFLVFQSQAYARRNNNINISPKTTSQRRFDVMMTLLLRHVPGGCISTSKCFMKLLDVSAENSHLWSRVGVRWHKFKISLAVAPFTNMV